MVRTLAVSLAAILLLAGCTQTRGGSGEPGESSNAPSPSKFPTPTETVPPDPGPKPRVGECHDLSFRQAVAVVGRTAPVSCRKRHTAQTYFVGRLELETAGGHTRRADSRAAQRQARTTCTSRLPRHLGVSPRELRLEMSQAVWFAPSPARAAAGADWFRCDVVVVAAPSKLLQLPRRTRGWGGSPATAMCATAAPGTRAFERVTCSADHTWLAASSVDIPGKRQPRSAEVADRMESACRDVARSRADDPLDFTWSQESPTKEQWRAGKHYGICWVPA